MPGSHEDPITTLITAAMGGDKQAAADIFPAVYDDLRQLAQARLRHLPPGQTLQPTALVHEAYMRVAGEDDPGWDGRAHFFGAAARAMRNILVDQARRKAAVKHGGDRKREAIDPDGAATIAEPEPVVDMLELDSALKSLEAEDPRAAEVVHLRFFAGLSEQQISDVLGVSVRTVRREWAYARAKLHKALADAQEEEEPIGDA